MWELKTPQPVKLIVGILAADKTCLAVAVEALLVEFGKADFLSDIWPFTQTDYYSKETGANIIRRFVTFHHLVDPADLPKIKLKTNALEQQLALQLDIDLPRPINLDPGFIESSKLVLATTKNYSHRIYIGQKIYAEVTLIYSKGAWQSFDYTYPDYKLHCYHDFFTKVRTRLMEQLRSNR